MVKIETLRQLPLPDLWRRWRGWAGRSRTQQGGWCLTSCLKSTVSTYPFHIFWCHWLKTSSNNDEMMAKGNWHTWGWWCVIESWIILLKRALSRFTYFRKDWKQVIMMMKWHKTTDTCGANLSLSHRIFCCANCSEQIYLYESKTCQIRPSGPQIEMRKIETQTEQFAFSPLFTGQWTCW